jgi:hypothetical protein
MADRRLQVFHAVAKHLSFTKAAETLLDDAALMQFGFRFLHQVLFGEMSIPIHAENAVQRQACVTEQRARIEREAAQRRAREDEGDIAPELF